MRIWTYIRPFSYRGEDYVVELAAYLTRNVSRLWRGDELLDEQSVLHMDGAQVLVHVMPAADGHSAWVEVGMVNWVTPGIAVFDDGQTVHESHPGKNVRVLEGLQQGTAMSSMTSQSDSCHKPETEPEPTAGSDLNVAQMIESNQSKWERNKYSIYADMALGALFFLVGKFTEDLALAAIIGAAAGLALVGVQRFVKVDLLGGFAVIGTIMLLISAGFSLVSISKCKLRSISARISFLPLVVFCCKAAFWSILLIKLPVDRKARVDAPIRTTPALAATSTSGKLNPLG